MSKKYLIFLLFVLVLGVDILSKHLTISYINQFHPIPIFQNLLGIDFFLVYITNKGAAWGILADYQSSLMIFRCIMVGLIALYTFFINKNPRVAIPLTLIATGAFGNIVDYYLYGHVIDMFLFVFWGYHYPVFNIADSAIFIGIFWIFFLSWKK